MPINNTKNRNPKFVPAAEIPGCVDCASWLTTDILLIMGWFHDPGSVVEASLRCDQGSIPLEVRSASYRRLDIPGADQRSGKVLTARLKLSKGSESTGQLVLAADDKTIEVAPPEIADVLTNLETLIAQCILPLDPDEQTEVMELLNVTLAEYQGAGSLQLSRNIFKIREAIRERQPQCEISPTQPRGLYIDDLLAIDSNAFYIKGWMRDNEAEISALTAISPEGSRTELLEGLFRFARPDVEQFYGASTKIQRTAKSGFIGYFETKTPSYLVDGWVLEMRNSAGMALELTTSCAVRDQQVARNAILADLLQEQRSRDDLLSRQIFPAISRLQKQAKDAVRVDRILQYGVPMAAPEVSLIVPLYERVDFLEHQMAQFVHDPEIARMELIYVLDSPELADDLDMTAAKLFRLYRIPFRLIVLEQNSGFSAANNAAASLAHGRLLLLLNSDVLPDKPGWLGTLTAFYDSTPSIGALGPKLLYEDDSLQHAGMYFSWNDFTALWENEHYFKGLHRSLPLANIPRPVPAVTGACMLLDRELYLRLGGLRGVFVQGDYEDSDLCLRLIEAGYENWYLPTAELYHLEGQSYPGTLRALTAQYNLWVHTRLWNSQIEAVMACYEAGSDAKAASSLTERAMHVPLLNREHRDQHDTALTASLLY